MKISRKSILTSSIILGGIFIIIPFLKSNENTITSIQKYANNSTLDSLPGFMDLVNEFVINNNRDIENYIKKGFPSMLNISIGHDENNLNYEAELENSRIYISSDKKDKSINNIQYSINSDKEDAILFIYSRPLNEIFTKEDIEMLSDDEKIRAQKPSISAICELHDYKSFNNLYKNLELKHPLSKKFKTILNAISNDGALSITDAKKIIKATESSIIETIEYEEDCTIDTKSYEFKDKNSSLYIGVESQSEKVWAIQYTENKGNDMKAITFKNRPFMNAGDKIKFHVNINSDSIEGIKKEVRCMSELIK